MFPKVTWGKYAPLNIRMDELPESYLEWIINNFSDRYIRVCARNILNGKDIDIDPGLFVILEFKEPDLILIDAPYCLKEYIKELPDREWNPELKRWTCKLEFYEDVIDTFPNSTVSDPLIKALKQRTDLQSTLYEHNFINDAKIDTINPLRDYQRAALVFMLYRPSTFINLDMGLGKTLVTIEYLLQSKHLPALVVCPAIVKNVWVTELEKWSDYTYEVLSGKQPYPIKESDITIINYDIIANWESELGRIPYNTIVFDESHYLKSNKTKRTIACTKIGLKAPHRILMTGTPIMSRTSDLFPQLHLIQPNTYSNYFSFTKRYSDGYTDEEKGFWDASGSSNLNELKHRLYNTFCFKRTKQEVMPELPPKISQEVFFDTPEGYYAIQKRGVEGLTKRIMYIANAKIKPTINFLKDMMINIDSCLFYTMHTDYLHKVCDKLEVPYIDGSVTGVKRDRILNDFKQGREPLIGANILSLGIGVSLDNCHTVVCGEVAWTPAQLDQGIDRCHRMTTTEPVNIYYLLMPNSIDYQIKQIVADKREIIRSVTHLQQVLKTVKGTSSLNPSNEKSNTQHHDESGLRGFLRS